MLLATERLIIREFTLADAPFILELINEPAFHLYIGDRGVRDVAGAEGYLRDKILASYAQHGHGLWLVTLKDGTPIGMNGLLKRDILPLPDLGFAFLARHNGKGYGYESSVAVLRHGREALKMREILAITALENPASIGLLGKLGFRFDRIEQLAGYPGPSRVFVQINLDPSLRSG